MKVKSTIKRIYAFHNDEHDLDMVGIELAKKIDGFKIVNDVPVETLIDTVKVTRATLIRVACQYNDAFGYLYDCNREGITKNLSMFFYNAAIEVESTKIEAGTCYAYDDDWSLVILDGKNTEEPATASADDIASDVTLETEAEPVAAPIYKKETVAARSFFKYSIKSVKFTDMVTSNLQKAYEKALEQLFLTNLGGGTGFSL